MSESNPFSEAVRRWKVAQEETPPARSAEMFQILFDLEDYAGTYHETRNSPRNNGYGLLFLDLRRVVETRVALRSR